MAQEIIILHANGARTTFGGAAGEKLPTLEKMQEIVGGHIELVTVLDRVEADRMFYTYMVVNEDGLNIGLPRNEAATEIYQRNTRLAYPDAENPFLAALDDQRKSAEARGFAFVDAMPAEYSLDPYISGDAIYFSGWTRDELKAEGF